MAVKTVRSLDNFLNKLFPKDFHAKCQPDVNIVRQNMLSVTENIHKEMKYKFKFTWTEQWTRPDSYYKLNAKINIIQIQKVKPKTSNIFIGSSSIFKNQNKFSG